MLIRQFRPVAHFFQRQTKLAVFLAAILVVALLLLGNSLFANNNDVVQQTTVVKRGSIENSIGSLGTLEPKEYVDVGTQVSGLLNRLLVEIGDTVEKGQLLAEIDPTVYESRVRNTRSTLTNLEAQLALQKAELELAKARAQRNNNLFEANAVSRDTMMASQTAVDVSEARIRSILAQREAAEASLDGDLANLGYTKIYAPMDGTIVDASAIEGQTINASQTAPTIVRIAKLDVMTVRAQVSEADVVKIKEDMPVYFTTLGMPTRRWHATVRKVLPTPEIVNNVVLYNVLVDVENIDRALMTSMTTQVFFVRERAEDTLVIPASALRTPPPEILQNSSGKQHTPSPETRPVGKGRGRPASHFVMVKNGKANEWRQVTLGVRTRTELEVLDGLREGEEVVTGFMGPPNERRGGLPTGGRFR